LVLLHGISGWCPQQVSCPVLLVRGAPALGGVIDDEDIKWFKSRLPKSVVVSAPGVGHNIHSQKPTEFSRAITAFLAIL